MATKMLALNDEALSQLSSACCVGEIRLGVPHDVVYPAIPGILKRMAQAYPRVRINLVSSFTILMKQDFGRGLFDVMLTTEETPDPGAEVLSSRALVWVGAHEGNLAVAPPAVAAGVQGYLHLPPPRAGRAGRGGHPWEMATGGESEQAVEATVAADLAVSVRMQDTAFPKAWGQLRAKTSCPRLAR